MRVKGWVMAVLVAIAVIASVAYTVIDVMAKIRLINL